MSPTGTDSHLNVRAAFVGRDVHALLRDLLKRKATPALRGEHLAPDSEVVASYSTSDQTLTLSSLLYGRLPVEFHLRPNSRSYESFLRLLLEELRRIAHEEKLSGKSEDQHSVAQLTSHLEQKIRTFAEPISRAPQGLAQIIDVFRDDVEQIQGKSLPVSAMRPLLSRQGERTRGFRFVDSRSQVPQFISGFLNLEVDRVAPTPTTSRDINWSEAHETMKRAFRVLSGRLLEVQGTRATVEFVCELPSIFLDSPEIAKRLQFLLHWGRYSGSNKGWWDQEISFARFERLSKPATGNSKGRRFLSRRRMGGLLVQVETLRLRKQINLEFEAKEGSFGAVLCAQFQGQGDRCWGKIPGVGDLRFHVTSAQGRVPQGVPLRTQTADADARATFASYDRFLATAGEFQKENQLPALSRKLGALVRENPIFGKSISHYLRKATREIATEIPAQRKKWVRASIEAIQNLGVGSVALVAPEGPHAIAGGLAQVVVGLTSVFQDSGIETVIIAPLYEESQGSKHRSAEEIIRDGVILGGKKSSLSLKGSVQVPFGPELRSGSSSVTRNPFLAEVQVYEARSENIRAIFLRHPRFADKLYSPCESDEQIRRAIFLSRGALEVMLDERFEVSVDVVMTNDWLAGLLPVYLHTHHRYMGAASIKSLPVVHMLHNCGQAYQGRFYANQYGQDLWPVFDLPAEHFFGLSDPNDRRYLNLSAGAIFHASGGLLAVSKPYADALLTKEGGEGLEELFVAKQDILFGVSNGIDLHELRKFTWRVGEQACEAVGRKISTLKRFRSDSMLTRLEDYKQSSKILVQRARGLTENPNATLISLVGRIAEQKGVRLLADPGLDPKCSVLESILREFPCTQFLFAGPLSLNDPAAKAFATVVEKLALKYPGRIERQFSFLPHQEALEITLASNLFLMPSRYEPGGITQLEALACGTPVVARKVGGIAATVEQYDPLTCQGNGFLFEEFESEEFHQELRKAIVLVGDSRHRSNLLRLGSLAENDWSNRAESYLGILQQVTGALCQTLKGPHFESRRQIVAKAKAE